VRDRPGRAAPWRGRARRVRADGRSSAVALRPDPHGQRSWRLPGRERQPPPPSRHVEGRESSRSGGRRLPALEPYSRHLRSFPSSCRAICRSRRLYSHPAVVGVGHLIRHFPEHRKLALLADEPPPGFNAFSSLSARRPTPLACSSLPASSMPARRSEGRVHLRAWAVPGGPRRAAVPLPRPRARAMARPFRPAARRASTPSRAAHHDFGRVVIPDGLGPPGRRWSRTRV